jgi:DNA (cytosine-5)-methyltransferase 1
MKPRLLDAFCCQGGAGMGYSRAGFDVTGIDIELQQRYPFAFFQGDAVAYIREHGHEYDAIHASPPCQHYAPVTLWRGDQDDHPDLVGPTRQALIATGRPWIIENVPGAPLRPDYILCGSMFGLRVIRHRWFETSWGGYDLRARCQHPDDIIPFEHKDERAFADAMGCEWMNNLGGREAIPPAMTVYLGGQLLEHMTEAAA